MKNRFTFAIRVAAFFLIAGSGAVLASPAEAAAFHPCPETIDIGCTVESYCNLEWANAFCVAHDNNENCIGDGDDCINWPWSGCGWGEKHVIYQCSLIA